MIIKVIKLKLFLHDSNSDFFFSDCFEKYWTVIRLSPRLPTISNFLQETSPKV